MRLNIFGPKNDAELQLADYAHPKIACPPPIGFLDLLSALDKYSQPKLSFMKPTFNKILTLCTLLQLCKYCGGGINEVANERELSWHSAPAQPPSEDSLWYDNDL